MAKSKKVVAKKVVAPGEAPVVVAAAPVPVTAAEVPTPAPVPTPTKPVPARKEKGEGRRGPCREVEAPARALAGEGGCRRS